MSKVIEIKNIKKKFKEKSVLNNISLNIYDGECVALLGKNGAGKSTLLNLVLGLFYPTSGEITLKYSMKEVGFLSQVTRFPDDITVGEMIEFISSFSSNPLSKEEIDHVLKFNANKYSQLIATCSSGEQRLFDTCLALINRPKLLIIDEPTIGMDTSTRNHFWMLMKELKKQGITIVFTTHYIGEVDYCADRVILLEAGKVRADDTPYHLRTLNKGKVMIIEVSVYEKYREVLKRIILEKHIKMEEVGEVVVWKFKNEHTEYLINELLKLSVPFDNIEIKNTSMLDTIFSKQSGEMEVETHESTY